MFDSANFVLEITPCSSNTRILGLQSK